MTLTQFQDLKRWHLRHWREQPLESHAWNVVLTLWMIGWVGAPAALLIDVPWAEFGGLALLFLPGLYVAGRMRLHRARRLRCDWLVALR